MVLTVGVGLPDDPAAKCFNDMYLSAKSQRAVGEAGPYHNDENLKRAAAFAAAPVILCGKDQGFSVKVAHHWANSPAMAAAAFWSQASWMK